MADRATIAFAGAARQAEMVRAGEVSPTELVRLHLERIERLDPQLNSFRVVFAERALLEAEQAEARLKGGDERPLLGRADRDQGRSRRRRRGRRPYGTDGFAEPAAADSEMVRRLREAGAIVVGMTLLPELAICGFTESATYGVTRNPWNPQRTPGRLQRRLAPRRSPPAWSPIASAADGAGSIRIPAASCGLFGLKPQRGRVSLAPRPRRLERALRRTAASAARVLDTALWLDVVSGGSEEAGAPPPPERPFVESAQTPPGKLRVAYSTLAPRAVAPPTVSDEAKARGRRDRRAAALARPRGRRSGTPTGAGSATTQRPLPARRRRRRRAKSRTRSGSNAAPAASARLGRLAPRRALREGASRGAASRRRPRQRDLRRPRRADDAGDGRHGAAGAPLGGPRRAPDRARDEPLLSLLRSPGTTSATRRWRCPPASPPTACRSRSRSSAAPATRRPCSRSPPSSRPSGPGRTAARRSPDLSAGSPVRHGLSRGDAIEKCAQPAFVASGVDVPGLSVAGIRTR